jgi:hypothetical protein
MTFDKANLKPIWSSGRSAADPDHASDAKVVQ